MTFMYTVEPTALHWGNINFGIYHLISHEQKYNFTYLMIHYQDLQKRFYLLGPPKVNVSVAGPAPLQMIACCNYAPSICSCLL